MLLNVKPYGNGQPNTNKEELEMKAQLDTHKAKKIKQFNDTKGKAFKIIFKENCYYEEHERFAIGPNPKDNGGRRHYSRKNVYY
jgi:hypothetical protein